MKDLVSIITPMYNGEKFVEQTILSVQKQSYPNWELIIVDDGSKDAGPSIVESYAEKDMRIRLIKQKNAGSSAARNNALRNAHGRFICFLDADDFWEDNFLESQISFMNEKKAALVFASYKRVNVAGEEILTPYIVPSEVDYKSLLKTCSISCLTAMYDRTVIGNMYFNEALKSMRDDFAFWLSILKKGIIAYGNKDVLASYRVMSSTTTGKKYKVLKPQFFVYYKIEKLGLVRSIYYLACWAIAGFIKYRK